MKKSKNSNVFSRRKFLYISSLAAFASTFLPKISTAFLFFAKLAIVERKIVKVVVLMPLPVEFGLVPININIIKIKRVGIASKEILAVWNPAVLVVTDIKTEFIILSNKPSPWRVLFFSKNRKKIVPTAIRMKVVVNTILVCKERDTFFVSSCPFCTFDRRWFAISYQTTKPIPPRNIRVAMGINTLGVWVYVVRLLSSKHVPELQNAEIEWKTAWKIACFVENILLNGK